MYNHNGYWVKGGTRVGKGGTALKCSDDCIEDDKCVAINYHYLGPQKGECYHYQGIANLIQANEKVHSSTHTLLTKAYIRCPGKI